jgi:hypothetical protein
MFNLGRFSVSCRFRVSCQRSGFESLERSGRNLQSKPFPAPLPPVAVVLVKSPLQLFPWPSSRVQKLQVVSALLPCPNYTEVRNTVLLLVEEFSPL